MSIKILAGTLKGLYIDSPNSARPTLSRFRQTLFDILESFASGNNFGHFFEGKIVLDCFAGSGALGFEALSRGASFAYFIDRDRKAVNTIFDNAKKLGVISSCKIMQADATTIKPSENYRPEICDIVFIDPPYGQVSIKQTINNFQQSGWIDDNSLLIIEEPARSTEEIPNTKCLLQKCIGISSFRLMKTARHC